MSTNTYDNALDLLPSSSTGKGGKFRSIFKLFIQALTEGREAEATYKREVARGAHPAKAAAKAFAAC